MRIHAFPLTVAAILTLGAVGFMGCQGNTDGGASEDGDFRDNVFIGDQTSNGTIGRYAIQLRSRYRIRCTGKRDGPKVDRPVVGQVTEEDDAAVCIAGDGG